MPKCPPNRRFKVSTMILQRRWETLGTAVRGEDAAGVPATGDGTPELLTVCQQEPQELQNPLRYTPLQYCDQHIFQ